MSIYFCVVTYLKHLTQQQFSLAVIKYTAYALIIQNIFECFTTSNNAMSIDKNTRLIDLTVADLMVVIKDCMTGFIPVDPIVFEDDEIGGYEIAETVTGYSRQTLYQLKSAGKLPHIALPGGGIRFSKKMLINWLLSHQKLTNQEIQEKAETLKIKRKLRRKY